MKNEFDANNALARTSTTARWNRRVMNGNVGRSWMRGTWRQRVMFAANLNGKVNYWGAMAR